MNESISPVVAALVGLVILGSFAAWTAIALYWRDGRPVIDYSPRRPVPWRGVDVLFLGISFLAFEIGAAAGAHALGGSDERDAILWLLLFQSLSRLAWFLLSLAHLRLRGADSRDLGFDFGHFRYDLKVGGWMFLAAIVPVSLVQLFFTQFLGVPSEHPLIVLTQDDPSLLLMVGASIAAVGIAPWLEEYAFRVIFQGWLEAEQIWGRLRRGSDSERPGYAPLLIASLVFAAMHFSAGPDPVAIFLLSLFLGYAYRQSHRLLPSLAIHAGINGWTILNLWILYLARIAL